MKINKFMSTVVFNKVITVAALKNAVIGFSWTFTFVGGIIASSYYRNSVFESLIELVMFFLIIGIIIFFLFFILSYFFTFLSLLRMKSCQEFLKLDDKQKGERITDWFNL